MQNVAHGPLLGASPRPVRPPRRVQEDGSRRGAKLRVSRQSRGRRRQDGELRAALLHRPRHRVARVRFPCVAWGEPTRTCEGLVGRLQIGAAVGHTDGPWDTDAGEPPGGELAGDGIARPEPLKGRDVQSSGGPRSRERATPVLWGGEQGSGSELPAVPSDVACYNSEGVPSCPCTRSTLESRCRQQGTPRLHRRLCPWVRSVDDALRLDRHHSRRCGVRPSAAVAEMRPRTGRPRRPSGTLRESAPPLHSVTDS